MQTKVSTRMPPEMWLKAVEAGMRYALYTLAE